MNYIPNDKGCLSVIPYQGVLFVEILSDNKIAYLHSRTSVFEKNGKNHYNITVYSLENNKKVMLSHPYTRVRMPDRWIDNKDEGPVKDHLKNDHYISALYQFKSDRKYLFAFTYSRNDDEEYLVDIFDVDEGRYLRSAYFPIVPDFISNGKAYYRSGQQIFSSNTVPMPSKKKEEAKFPTIDVYRIDPRVYEK